MLNFVNPALDFMEKGGVMLYTIVFASWIAIAIIIERFWSFQRMNVQRKKLMANIGASLKRKKVIEAISVCDKISRPLSRVVKAGLLRHDRGKAEIKEAMQEAGQEELTNLERYLPILGTLAYVTPLLGFLGTVMGMIRVFMEIQKEVEFATAASLAGGIWEALISTAAGLVVAIPALIAYNYFVGRVDGFLMDVEGTAVDLVNLLSMPGEEL
ncbi:MAG: MotA/TolQ/ExbB proton channel family protein [Nitrospirae bacterium]|nr:MotA/TolQ/ExbB proton channel family protein [Nitrospirota bacterium]